MILTNSILQSQSFGWSVFFYGFHSSAVVDILCTEWQSVWFVVCMKLCYVLGLKVCLFKYAGCCKSHWHWRQRVKHQCVKWRLYHSVYGVYLRDIAVFTLHCSMFLPLMRYKNWSFHCGEGSCLLCYVQKTTHLPDLSFGDGFDCTLN